MILTDFIRKYPQYLIIDLHGCRNNRKCDCSIWSDDTKLCDNNLINIFEDQFKEHTLSVDRGSEFMGGQVTRQCGMLTNAFQLEVKRKLRSFEKEDSILLKAFTLAMEQAIIDSNNHYETYQKRKNNLLDRNNNLY